MGIDSISSDSSAYKPGAKVSKTYNLNTNEGKIAYLNDLNKEMQVLLNTKYAQYKDKPNYPKFLAKVKAEIEQNNKELKNPENLTLEGNLSPKRAANNTLEALATSSELLPLEERSDDAFKDLENLRAQSKSKDPFDELRNRKAQAKDTPGGIEDLR